MTWNSASNNSIWRGPYECIEHPVWLSHSPLPKVHEICCPLLRSLAIKMIGFVALGIDIKLLQALVGCA